MAKLHPATGLVYATYLGGTGDDYGTGIAVDGQGNIHVAGTTKSYDSFPLVSALQTTPTGMFVTKLIPSGTAILYSTFLGASGDEMGPIALDPGTNELVAIGETGGMLMYSPLAALNGNA